MWTLIQEGGYWMWFLLAFGLAAIIAGALYARSPSWGNLRVVVGLGVTTLFSSASGIAGDLSAVGHRAPEYVNSHPGTKLPEVVLLGVGESMSPGIIGFSMLTIVALLVTYGLFRDRQAP